MDEGGALVHRPQAPPCASSSASATVIQRTKSMLKRLVDDDSWTSVDHKELDHATSYVSESMYLVMENPVSSLYVGEVVSLKVHALCDKSTTGFVGVNAGAIESKHGTLFLTNYRLLFLSFQKRDESKELQEIVEVDLNNIAELAECRAPLGKATMLSQIEISCKNFEIIKFNFPSEAMSGELYVRINQTLAATQPQTAYVFTETSRLPDSSGWGIYDPQSEFSRLEMPTSVSQRSGFRVTHVNENYKMCPTYPSRFIVPAAVSDGELRKMSHFRARGRVPAVTYRHKSNGAIIARCSQPLVGLRRKRCPADEACVAALQREGGGKLVFVDCRSQTSAYGNIALGGGFEVLDYYRDTNIMFMGIENIHSMRDSIRKLFDLIKNEVRGNERSNWWSCLESTRWLEHVRSVLVSCSACVTKIVDENTSVLIHCSDGWDRTAQIAALTKLCVDPFYRTVRGFQVLVEQEWCAFGHQFRARSGHSHDRSNYWEDDHASPVFMQFIDAVWQLMRQFPCSFEFSERFLIALLDEVYGKRSGTFLHDHEEARVGSKTTTRCISAWTLLSSHSQAPDFVNPFYNSPIGNCDGSSASSNSSGGGSDRSPAVLQFKWHTSSLAIWTGFYLRALESSDTRDAWSKELQVTQREFKEKMNSEQQKLEHEKSELQKELETLRQRLQLALEGQIYNDSQRGLVVHEQVDDEEDGVLLSVTPVRTSEIDPTIGFPPNESPALSTGISGFLGATINPDFEILHSYFETASSKSSSRTNSQSKTNTSALTAPTSANGSSISVCGVRFASNAATSSPSALEEMVQ